MWKMIEQEPKKHEFKVGDYFEICGNIHKLVKLPNGYGATRQDGDCDVCNGLSGLVGWLGHHYRDEARLVKPVAVDGDDIIFDYVGD